MTLGKKIKNLREEKGWVQKQLAARLEVGISTVATWESDVNGPNPTQRKKLCEVFGITLDELYGISSSRSGIDPKIMEALQDPIAVKALLATHKNTQDIKDTIKVMLECIPNLSQDKRQAIVALCR